MITTVPTIKCYQNIDEIFSKYNVYATEKNIKVGDLTYVLIAFQNKAGQTQIKKYQCVEESDLFLYIHTTSYVKKAYTRYEMS